MIEKRLVQWYAADAGVDLDIAEREIVLTYVLRILADRGLLAQLAFKGGTAIRKLILGRIYNKWRAFISGLRSCSVRL